MNRRSHHCKSVDDFDDSLVNLYFRYFDHPLSFNCCNLVLNDQLGMVLRATANLQLILMRNRLLKALKFLTVDLRPDLLCSDDFHHFCLIIVLHHCQNIIACN
jgi:hypothetical protein